MGFQPLDSNSSGFTPLEDSSSGFTPIGENGPPSFLDHMGDLLKNANMFGTIGPEQVPTRAIDQMAIGAALIPNNLETLYRAHPDNLAGAADPENQARLQTLKGDRAAAQDVIKEIQKDDNTVARFGGDVLQSVPGSSLGLAAAAVPGVSVPMAMAAGLGSNMAVETASDFTQRLDEFGQHPADALGPAVAHGAVATALEVLPMHAAFKYIKGASKAGPMLMKVGVGEFAQEGLTQAYDDTVTNAEGFTSFTPEERLQRAGVSGLQGMAMAPLMGGAAHVVQVGKTYGQQKAQEKAEAEIDAKIQQIQQEFLGTVDREMAGRTGETVPTEPLTPEENALAAIQRKQMQSGLDVAPTPAGAAFGALLNASMGAGLAAHEFNSPLDEGGISQQVLERRTKEWESASLPPSQWPITAAAGNENLIGLTTEQVGGPQGGVVYGIGDSVHTKFTPELKQAVVDSVSEIARKYFPNQGIILNFEGINPHTNPDAFANYMTLPGENGLVHMITPREMPNLVRHRTSDTKTSNAFLYSIAHELGHAVKIGTFFQGVEARSGKGLTARIIAEVKAGGISPESLQELAAKSPEEAALLADWAGLRERASNGTISAQEFIASWAGMRKLGDSVSKNAENQGFYTWGKERLASVGLNVENATALELLTKKRAGSITAEDIANVQEYWLSFDEFMAEQFSRAAHVSGTLAKTSLGQFFTNALAKLRSLFVELKKEGAIAPRETFQAWLDKQVKRAARQKKGSGEQVLPSGIVRKQQEVAAQAGAELEGPKAPPEQVEVPKEEELANIPNKEKLESVLQDMLFSGMLEEKSPRAVAVRGMIKRGELERARTKLEEVLGESIHWDREYTSKTVQRLPKGKETYKLATVRGVIAQQDIRPIEREIFAAYLDNAELHGQEEVSKAALEFEQMIYGLELTPKLTRYEDVERLEMDSEILGVQNPQTLVFNAPFPTGLQNHFYEKNYVSHVRFGLNNGTMFVYEVQGDGLTRGDGKTMNYLSANAAVRGVYGAWQRRTVEETLAWAFKQGIRTVAFAQADTAALVQGWDQVYHSSSLEGFELPAGAVEANEHLVGERLTGDIEWKGDLWAFNTEIGTNIYVAESEVFHPALKQAMEEAKAAPVDYGRTQAKYNLYKKDLAKLLPQYQKDMAPEKRVRKDTKGHEWFIVDTSVKNEVVTYWDRDSSTSPVIPFAGNAEVKGANTAEEGLSFWERLKVESPFFKSWFGGSKIVAEGKPLAVWAGTGNAVQTLEDGSQVFWLSANPWQAFMTGDKTEWGGAVPRIAPYAVKAENPLEVDAGYQPFTEEYKELLVFKAKRLGHDGLIVRNVVAPLDTTMYAVWDADALAQFPPGYAELPEFHWDQDSEGQKAAQEITGLLGSFWTKAKLRGNNIRAKMVDTVIQLQQAAHAQPEDIWLNSFVHRTVSAERMKNNLQVDAETLSGEMASHDSPATIRELHQVLKAEWKGEVLHGTLIGKNAAGEVVWGGQDAPTDAQARAQVTVWEVQDSLGLRGFLKTQGVDTTTPQGERILELYLRTRNVFLKQFRGLEITLLDKALRQYENAPTLLKQERFKIAELMGGLYASPFLPQGNFGNYVLIVQKDQGPVPFGQRRFKTIRREHFENKADFQVAYVKWQKAARGDATIQVKSRELADMEGFPMQLPQELLEKIAESGMLTDEQIEFLHDVMLASKYDKVGERYRKLSEKIEGANNDFLRVFSAFTWHNANYIWKMHFKADLNSVLAMARSEIRGIEKRMDLAPEEQMAMLDRKRRNLGLMERSLDYLISPEQEFQTARLWMTMAYLAYNIKTAVMNFSTQINTWAAVSSEYGELQGNKLYFRALADVASLPFLDKRMGLSTEKEKVRLMELKALLDQAERDGVVDQSYAYFLAGQANTAGALRGVHNSWVGRAGHVAMETGMLPFRAVEKLNRISTLIVFYEAERGIGTDIGQAYAIAQQKMNLLQNSYTAANKPQLLRGKKSILLMFASYTQFMGWITAGGYERGARAQAKLQGREVAGVWHGTTMKIWLMYLLLGGLMGVPYAENVLDFVQWAWRKLFPNSKNLEVELREFIKDVGGDPNLVMHGLLHNMTGFDLSGSFGLGRLLPGVDLLNREFKKPEEALGKSVMTFAGPAGGFYGDVVAALRELSKGEFMAAGKELPGATGAVFKAMDAYIKQESQPTYGVTTKSGARLTYDTRMGEFRDLTTKELVGMALGANPTLLSQNREKGFTQMGEIIYWQLRRGDLMDKYWKAVRQEDADARAAIREDVLKFNEEIPDHGLRITGKDLASSVKTRKKANASVENRGTSQKRYRGIADEVGNSFMEGGEE
jgi:hypothetical protein